MAEENIYLTQEKLDELKKQFEYLKNTKRREVASRIHEAQELGDLSENAEYAEAKDEQAWTEGKILELAEIIKKATIIENKKQDSNIVRVGSKIKAQTDDKEFDFEIVGSQEADPLAGKISNESPLGKAFLGKEAGSAIEVDVPKGMVKYKIVAIR